MVDEQKKIKAVIFDWGGVCCSGAELFTSVTLQQKISLNPDQIAAQVKNIYSDYYKGLYRSEDFWLAVLKHFDLAETEDINPDVLLKAYLDSYTIYEKVLNCIIELKTRYKIGLLSNLTPEMKEHIRQAHKLKKYFDIEVYSCDLDVRAQKPESKPYEVILNKLNFPASCCLFIDDSSANIEKAKSLGMQTHLFENKDNFLQFIKKI